MIINKLLSHVGLVLIQRSYLNELLSKWHDLAFADAKIERLEAEIEEYQFERDALKIKAALLNLRYEAEAIGYEVHWLREGEGECFSLCAQDSLTFTQTLDDIEHALEIVRHDAAEVAESEVQNG